MQSLIKETGFKYQHRVSYSETDQMNFLHHSNYARIYENARWEFFRSLDIPYSKIEMSGVLMPVINMDFKFIKPAIYDDLLNIEVRITKISGAKITFTYCTFNSEEQQINTASLTIACIGKADHKPIRIPLFILNTLYLHRELAQVV